MKTIEYDDPDTLELTKDQVLEKFIKIEENIMQTNEGIANKVKFKLVFGFINWLVNHYDIKILNNIFLGMIKEFDEIRYDNALEGNRDNLATLEKLKEIRDNKEK
jgi:hypothetical protein